MLCDPVYCERHGPDPGPCLCYVSDAFHLDALGASIHCATLADSRPRLVSTKSVEEAEWEEEGSLLVDMAQAFDMDPGGKEAVDREVARKEAAAGKAVDNQEEVGQTQSEDMAASGRHWAADKLSVVHSCQSLEDMVLARPHSNPAEVEGTLPLGVVGHKIHKSEAVGHSEMEEGVVVGQSLVEDMEDTDHQEEVAVLWKDSLIHKTEVDGLVAPDNMVLHLVVAVVAQAVVLEDNHTAAAEVDKLEEERDNASQLVASCPTLYCFCLYDETVRGVGTANVEGRFIARKKDV